MVYKRDARQNPGQELIAQGDALPGLGIICPSLRRGEQSAFHSSSPIASRRPTLPFIAARMPIDRRPAKLDNESDNFGARPAGHRAAAAP